MDEIDNRKPATPEQIESMINNLKLTLESSYHELYVDMMLMEALNKKMLDTIPNLDKEYIDKMLRVHSNVCYANMCLCVQMRASLKASLFVEKQFIIRRSVVTAHEIFKNLYGFGGITQWLDIEPLLQQKYLVKCQEIQTAADDYRLRYAQVSDMDTRNVAKHFSNKPEEFYDRMSLVDERSVSDRIVSLMKFLQPIHSLLVEELRQNLGIYYLILIVKSMPKQRFEAVGLITDDKLEAFKHGLTLNYEIVIGLFDKIGAVRAFASQNKLEMTSIPEWQFLVDNNLVVHILYIFLDLASTFLAFTRSETFAEYQLNLAYLFLSAHEGFKKLYGFDENKKGNTFWNRAVIAELQKLHDNTLVEEAAVIEKRLSILSLSDYLKDDEKAMIFSDIKTDKNTGKENAILALDCFINPLNQAFINDLSEFLSVMIDIVHLANKMLSLESAESNRRTHETFEKFRQMFDKIDASVAENVKDVEQLAGFNETTKKFRALIDEMESKLLGDKRS